VRWDRSRANVVVVDATSFSIKPANGPSIRHRCCAATTLAQNISLRCEEVHRPHPNSAFCDGHHRPGEACYSRG
jgi:hypothetical protein